MDKPEYSPEIAKQYARLKQKLSLFSLFLTPVLLGTVALTPLSSVLKGLSADFTSNVYLQLANYFLLFSVIFLAVDGPLSFYSGYIIEKRYQLTNHNLKSWLSFFVKRSVLSFLLSLSLILLLYATIWTFEAQWWLWAWAGYAIVSYLLGKIFPIWIVPLFYKYDQVKDQALRERILKLTDHYQLPVENLYTLNLSKTTKKANAAFMGMGKTKRVVLSDTLLDNFGGEEIETVVAHELGHYKHKDILKQLSLGLLTTFVGFGLCAVFVDRLSQQLSLGGIKDIACMPVLFLIFYLFSLVLTPLQSAFSRKMEYAADRFALDATQNADAFVSCMRKLAQVNFSDPDPNPLYEWYFYDHPCIKKRIQKAEAWRLGQA